MLLLLFFIFVFKDSNFSYAKGNWTSLDSTSNIPKNLGYIYIRNVKTERKAIENLKEPSMYRNNKDVGIFKIILAKKSIHHHNNNQYLVSKLLRVFKKSSKIYSEAKINCSDKTQKHSNMPDCCKWTSFVWKSWTENVLLFSHWDTGGLFPNFKEVICYYQWMDPPIENGK